MNKLMNMLIAAAGGVLIGVSICCNDWGGICGGVFFVILAIIYNHLEDKP